MTTAGEELMQVFAEDNVDRVEESIRVRVHGQDLALSLILVLLIHCWYCCM